jgi:sensor histidine kinase regulating citrate/malate metabolism
MKEEQVVQLLRNIRHDFGNHLQVISGYLDLGRSDAIREYINSLVEEMAEERIIFNSQTPEAALYFYQQLLMARERGINMRFQDLQVSSIKVLEKHQEPLQSIIKAAAQADDKRLSVSVRESEPGKVQVFISMDGETEPVSVAVME